VRWGCAVVLEKEALHAGDKVLFANICDCHGFKLGFAILLQILLHFSSRFFFHCSGLKCSTENFLNTIKRQYFQVFNF